MFKVQLLLIAFVVILSGCVKSSNSAKRHAKSKKSVEIVRHYEAYLADVPVPLGVQLIDNKADELSRSEAMMVAFQSTQDFSEIIAFYDREMERCGWQKACQVNSKAETMITFCKPNKICSLGLRHQKRSKLEPVTGIYIALGDNLIAS